MLQVGVPLVLLYALKHLRHEEQVGDELGRRQEQLMLVHVIAEGPHHLLVKSYHARVALQLLHVAIVVAGRAASVRLVVSLKTRRDVPRQLQEALEQLILADLARVVIIVLGRDQQF